MQSESARSVEEAFEAALEHARHVLPAQGPIGSFVHHNTLHAYQHLPFHRAIAEAHALHDGEGYLSEEQYRRALASGRISELDLTHALELRRREVADEPLGTRTRLEFERLLLRYGLSEAPSPEHPQPDGLREELLEESRELLCSSTLSFLELAAGKQESELDRLLAPVTSIGELSRLAHRDLPRVTARLLWAVCYKLAPPDAPPYQSLIARFRRDRTARDLLVAIAARDPNELTNPILVELLGAYLDVGMARWSMPHRERGLIACFLELMRTAPHSLPRFQQRALARLERIRGERLTVREFAIELLTELGVESEHFEAYVSRSLLELPGWSGMVARLEQNPSDRELDAPPASLAELTAIRLALDIEAYAACAREAGYAGSIAELDRFVSRRQYDAPIGNRDNARLLFDLCQLSALSAEELLKLGQPFAQRACALVHEFGESVRRRLLHEAYEHAHLREVLDAIARNREESAQEGDSAPPRFQVMFCIDDREESIRRYFEELAPGYLTYGVAGFFGVAMRFRGIDDANAAALCPVVVEPGHAIEEVPVAEHEQTLLARRRRQSLVARFRFEFGDSSRSLARGAALTPLLGLFSAVPLTFRVMFPHATERVARWLHARTLPQPRTELRLLRDDAPMRGSLASGFTIDEQAERVAGTLENVGVVQDFAPLITMLGHGASTVNNPHHSAYDCGACGGRNGGPNARAFAAMANSPLVRAKLRERGIDIPDSTWFLGGLHDTTTDEVRLADLELMPERFKPAFAELRAALDKARALSALERCRKFEHAPRTLTPEAALRHVEERAVDLSQARPELGHASNAVCVVGRRELSRGLFLDRRAFLVSYSAHIDPSLNILERILGAVVPVGAGINLEYYFSTVDNDVWGSGTKLPHNLSGLLGVMEGSSGDLRTGLPRQMIEVHDPVRLLSIIEATPEAILEVASRKPEVAELVTNEWVRLASVHPDTGAIQLFDGGRFRPYAPSLAALRSFAAAHDWYHGQLGFLSPVRIVKGKNRAA